MPCWSRRALGPLAALAVFAAGCAQSNAPEDPCERALQRLVNQCGFEIENVDDLELHCDGASACVATCLEKSPCEDVKSQSGEFADCIDGCQ
jgi:hypothetical protein